MDNLHERKAELGCKVYAYCLMTNHVHLVIDPGDQVENLGLLMKRVAGRQTRYVNMSIIWKNGAIRCPVKTGIKKQSWLDFNPFYMGFGGTSNQRAVKYGDWLLETVP